LPEWLLVDGSSMFFRAFYAIPQTMRGPDGKLNNAVRGTLDTLARYVTDRKPRRVAFTTDEDWRPAWRVELIKGYKEHRVAEPIPPALIPQVPVILDALTAVGVDVVGLDGYEAEDIVASLASKVKGQIEIASGDRDLFSLVRDRDVIVLYPQKTRPRSRAATGSPGARTPTTRSCAAIRPTGCPAYPASATRRRPRW
jgi:5'-3' exonuclease